MTASITNQDTIERLCTKVINACAQFAAQHGNNLRQRVQTSPSEHYVTMTGELMGQEGELNEYIISVG
jgi:hypothetical protein